MTMLPLFADATGLVINGVPIDMDSNLLTGAVLFGFAEAVQTPAIVSGALTLNPANGNLAEVTLTANVTSMTLASGLTTGVGHALTLILKQDGTGGRTVAWPANVTWLGGTPTMPAAANAVMVAAFLTTNGGSSWLGFSR